MFKQFASVLLLILTSGFVHGQVLIEVFTDGPAELNVTPGMHVIHYDLSEPQRIKREHSPKFPPNVDEATRLARAWFQSPAGLAYRAEMQRAYRGQQLLVSYRLTKTPAIVFGSGKFVVYGITDVTKAGEVYLQQLQHKEVK